MDAVLASRGVSIDLERVARGFANPVHDAQRCFRAALDAMANPGRVHRLVLEDFDPPPGVSPALGAVALTLCDAEVSTWFGGRLAANRALVDAARFHTGCRLADAISSAAFVFVDGASLSPALLGELAWGSDVAPHHGATLVVETETIEGGPSISFSGPGVPDVATLSPGGVDASFWHARRDMQAAFPCGVDIVFTSGDAIAAMPRSARVRN